MIPANTRPATLADLPTVAVLSRQTFAETYSAQHTPADMRRYLAATFNRQQLRRELADRATWFLLAEVAGQPIGYAKLRTGSTPPELAGQQPIELERIYVLRAWQGQRVGHALLTASLNQARQLGHRALWLSVWEHNQPALDFYARWGFEHFAEAAFTLGTTVRHNHRLYLRLN